MDLARIEQRLNEIADIVSVDPRLIRRVIKQHQAGRGGVPHVRCYAIRKAELARILTQQELGFDVRSQSEWVIFVARPSLRELRLSQPDLFARTIRAAFHARIHMALEERAKLGELDEGLIRKRVEQIGRTEFEEIRANLGRDDLLLRPADDREVYVEFAALYLELREFAPELIVTTFPGLNQSCADDVVASDVNLDELFGSAGLSALRSSRASFSNEDQVFEAEGRRPGREVSSEECERNLLDAERARERREHAKAAIFAANAQHGSDPEQRRRAESALQLAVLELCQRLDAAVRGRSSESIPPLDWAEGAALLARQAAELGSQSAASQLLFELERAAAMHEQPGFIVDLSSWILSLGKRRAVRTWTEIHSLPIARLVKRLGEHVERLAMPAASRATVGRFVQQAARLAEQTARSAVRPRITRALSSVGLAAHSTVEQQGRNKFVEELLDQALEAGFLSLPQLRDAVSRNDLKLPDLGQVDELWRGDPLLLADAALSLELDGVYRRGDIYLRVLQKLSSVAFGTRVGRVLSLFLVLPLLGAFVILEGIRHIIGPLLVAVGYPAIAPVGLETFALTTAALFALIHSEDFRATARQLLEFVGVVLAWVFFRIPRAILARPLVERWFARPLVRAFIRRVFLPALLGALVYLLTRFEQNYLRVAVALAIFVGTSLFMSSRLGSWLEDFALVQLVPTWHVLSRKWLPDLLRLVGSFFRTVMDGFERALYWMDEVVRFRRSRSKILLALAAFTGLFWSIVAFVIRIYVTLLVEPELNPIKHFPVVTVAHKLILPFLGDLLDIIERPLSLLGPVIGGALAGLTVFLLPSIFGFLAWELKENYRLYRATRPKYLRAARVGPHGETIRELMVVGVHSGVLPRLHERLRRAAHQKQERAGVNWSATSRSQTVDGGLNRLRDGLRRVEIAIAHFVQRELSAPLELTERWRFGALRVVHVELSSNRIRIELSCSQAADGSCELRFEQLGGRITAGIAEPGFLNALDAEQAQLFENALAGFYHRASVELVREQLESEVGNKYKIADIGLIVRPESMADAELTYRLDHYRPRKLRPRVYGGRLTSEARVLDSRHILYTHQRIAWRDWERAWNAGGNGEPSIPRLVFGPSLLAPRF